MIKRKRECEREREREKGNVETSLLSEPAIVVTCAKIGGKCDKICVQKKEKRKRKYLRPTFSAFRLQNGDDFAFFLSIPVELERKGNYQCH